MAGGISQLVRYLNRVWRKDPAPVLAFRLTCDGTDMTWSIAEGVLTTAPIGGTATPVTVELLLFTIVGLATWFSDQPGYSVPYIDTTGQVSPLSALALYDQSGDVNLSNGDHIFAFTNSNYAILGAYARELAAAKAQIAQMLLQMVIQTASGEWLDFQGTYYAVPRMTGETDVSYAARIIPTVLLPKSNNVAIANFVTAVFGQPVKVTDAVQVNGIEPLHDGSALRNGTIHYNSASSIFYGLFDIQVGQDILGAGEPLPIALLTQVVNTVRASGTQLRAVTGAASQIADTGPLPSVDTASMSVTSLILRNGQYGYDAAVTHSGALVETEALLG